MSSRLTCGIKLAELSRLSDARAGVADSIAPYRAKRLEKHVEQCAECRSSLRYLEQISDYTHTIQAQAESDEAADTDWLQNLLESLVLDTKPGKTIPLETPHPDCDLSQSEGAVRDLIRSTASTPQVLVLSTKLHGDITEKNAPCVVETHIQVALHHSIAQLATKTRQRIWQILHQHTDLNIQAVNLFVDDVAEEELLQEIHDAQL